MNDQTGRVLVVDDDETVRDVVRRYLEVAGFTVDMAGDGAEGLAKFAAHQPDLVVLDVMMPGINGLEVCRRLRQVSQVRFSCSPPSARRRTASPGSSSAPTTT